MKTTYIKLQTAGIFFASYKRERDLGRLLTASSKVTTKAAPTAVQRQGTVGAW